jgi:hypothetical protein
MVPFDIIICHDVGQSRQRTPSQKHVVHNEHVHDKFRQRKPRSIRHPLSDKQNAENVR